MLLEDFSAAAGVHCRIGSSENIVSDAITSERVHCRIGSSEIVADGI